MTDFQLLEHTADIGVAARGKSLAELFCAAAQGVRHLLTSSRCSSELTCDIELTCNDLEELLVSWLQEILYLFEAERFLPAEFTIRSVSTKHLTATVHGCRFDPERHQLEREIKAVTYHRLRVDCSDGMWQADIYLDL